MKLKEQIRFYLDFKVMNATQLAKKSGVPKQSISNWLLGSIPRDVRQVKKVADVLGVSIDHLMFGSGHDEDAKQLTELDEFLGDGWIGGYFEVKIRRVRR